MTSKRKITEQSERSPLFPQGSRTYLLGLSVLARFRLSQKEQNATPHPDTRPYRPPCTYLLDFYAHLRFTTTQGSALRR